MLSSFIGLREGLLPVPVLQTRELRLNQERAGGHACGLTQLQSGGSGMGTSYADSASLGPFWVLRREGVFQTTQDTVCAAWRVGSSGSPLHVLSNERPPCLALL